MRRTPTTFALVLGLVALAVVLALSIAAALSVRIGLRSMSETWGRMVVTTVLAADALSAEKPNAQTLAAMDALQKTGVSFSTSPPPVPVARISPLVLDISRSVGQLLEDPSRVTAQQNPQPAIWVRSAYLPHHWIVLHAVSYRRDIIGSSLMTGLFAGLIALAAAALAARLLTHPLERLSVRASALLAGDPMREALRGSPREVRQLASAIAVAGERQRQASRERELMLAGISHDLRTPLARLRLALELGDASDPQRIGAMVNDMEELDSALEQCLAFVRDGHEEKLREVDLATLIGQLLALRMQPDEWHYSGDAIATLLLRPTLLRRALANLMDNAERYGTGPYEITLQRRAKHIALSVEDNGPGVSAALLPRLGQPFVRGDPARGGRSGTGLGLSIVLRAAKLHEGELHLGNRPQGGFVATLELPLTR